MAVPLDTLARLEEFPASQVERSGTRWVAQYRGQILPLVNLTFALEEDAAGAAIRVSLRRALRMFACRFLCVITRNSAWALWWKGLSISWMTLPRSGILPSRAGVLYSVVVQGQVTELIDIPAVLDQAASKRCSTRLYAEVTH